MIKTVSRVCRTNGQMKTFLEGFHDVVSVNKIQYNRLGSTDMHVSHISLGTSAFGGVFGDVDLEQCYDIVEIAIKSGINYIDSAPWYGHGKAEEVLGEGLRQKNIPRKSYYLASKVGRYEKQIDERFDFSAERVAKSIDESLERIGVEYIDLIQVHDMEFAPSLDIIIDETLPALQEAKDAGKVRFIGITGYPLSNFRKVLERSTVHIDTILSYCHYSLSNTALLDHIPYFKSNGLGVINGSPTGMGLLTNQGPPSWHPAHSQIKEACKASATYAKENGVDIARLALKFSCSNNDINTTLVSAEKLQYMMDNINSATTTLSEKEEQVLYHIRDTYLIPLNNMSWEGVEVQAFRKALSKIRNEMVPDPIEFLG